ncbi:RNA recognition motif domain [Macleaya cordata]|uniref:RNA recognition motif domain n=1 Tax=Macleaya cordata TaxID=56857 RepID=A0A200QTK1_MACCD|nr:RNA recognition motif domain [Macleaya cordata]
MAKKRKAASSGTQPAKAAKKKQEQEEEQIQYTEEVDEIEEEMEAEDAGEEEEVEEEVDEEEGEEDEEEDEDGEGEEETLKTENNSNADPSASTSVASKSNADEDDDEDDSEEPFQKLIEPFTKSQLSDLLREAAEKHPDVLDSIRKLADVDPVHRKIFVHGLGWDTNAETLISVFKKYGEIEDCKAVCDKVSGKSKGYGFILFKHRSGARKALKEPQKKIGNRMTACQLASAGPVPAPAPSAPPVSEYTQRKIYVSNVGADIDPQKLLNFFSKFGEIEEGPLGLDKQTGKPKGFALFVYKSTESARKALEEPHKNFEGHVLHCQKAVDGPKPNKPFFQQHQSNHHSGGGRGAHYSRNENPKYSGSSGNHMTAPAGTGGHMMAQPGPYNGPTQGLNPVIGQALTALLASQGSAGLGLTNLLGTLGSTGMGAPVNPSVPSMVNSAMQGGYGNQPSGLNSNVMGGYGSQPGMQGGYQNPQMGQTNAGRSQQGGGHMGGVTPYMGH